MAFEWQMRTEEVDSNNEEGFEGEVAVIDALREDWEPFAVTTLRAGGAKIWFRRHVFIDRSEKATDTEGVTVVHR